MNTPYLTLVSMIASMRKSGFVFGEMDITSARVLIRVDASVLLTEGVRAIEFMIETLRVYQAGYAAGLSWARDVLAKKNPLTTRMANAISITKLSNEQLN